MKTRFHGDRNTIWGLNWRKSGPCHGKKQSNNDPLLQKESDDFCAMNTAVASSLPTRSWFHGVDELAESHDGTRSETEGPGRRHCKPAPDDNWSCRI